MQNTATENCPGLVNFYNTRPGNEVGLFLQYYSGLILSPEEANLQWKHNIKHKST